MRRSGRNKAVIRVGERFQTHILHHIVFADHAQGEKIATKQIQGVFMTGAPPEVIDHQEGTDLSMQLTYSSCIE